MSDTYIQWPSVGSGAATWGTITGTLSNQTDLWAQLQLFPTWLASSSNLSAGQNSGSAITIGTQNTFLGASSGNHVTIGNGNTGVGYQTLTALIGGLINTGIGDGSLTALTTGSANTALGCDSLASVVSGNDNVSVGVASLAQCTGSGNVALGYNAGFQQTAASNTFFLGNVRQSSSANDVAYSLMSGTFSGTAGSLTGQTLVINALTTIGATASTPQHILNTATATPDGGVGTLTNMPTGISGNPVGYIQITVNGNTHYLPYW